MTELTSQVDGKQLTLTRDFHAPQDVVYRAFTEAEQIVKWWGPVGFTTRITTMDVRPGGTWHYCMSSPDWGDSWGLATYLEVNPTDRLVYTDAFSDESGTVNPDLPVSTTVTTFAGHGERTTVTMVTDYATEADLQTVLEMGMLQGVESQFGRLDELLAAGRPITA